MKRAATSRPPRDHGVLWLLIPLVLTVVALAAMVAFSWPNSMLPLAGPPDPGAASMAGPWALPPAGGDPSVPAASEVLSNRAVEASAHAPTF